MVPVRFARARDGRCARERIASRYHPAGLADESLHKRPVVYAVAAELALLILFLGAPVLAGLLGGSWPTLSG